MLCPFANAHEPDKYGLHLIDNIRHVRLNHIAPSPMVQNEGTMITATSHFCTACVFQQPSLGLLPWCAAVTQACDYTGFKSEMQSYIA